MSIDLLQLKRLARRAEVEGRANIKRAERGIGWAKTVCLAALQQAASPAVLLEVIAELRSLRRDAERYRWLRNEGYRDIDTDQWSGEGESMDAFVDAGMAWPGKNEGHGHVFQRPDGVRARCGGPGACKVCSADLARKEKGQ